MLNRFTTPLSLKLLERDSERFDRRLGTDTANWVELDTVTVDDGQVDMGRPYVPTPPRLIRTLLARTVPAPEGWTFVDYGSGKGRALIVAAAHGFDRVVGVEFARELHEAAERNLRKVAGREPGAERIELVHGDATEFALPPGPLALFFNNPFTGSVFEDVVANIEESYREDRRPIVLAYQTMKAEDPGQEGDENLERLDRSGVLRSQPLRFPNPLDALMLRPFRLLSYSTRDALAADRRSVPVEA